MTPPTNIDGTDISGATIDGQDVKEITVDGQTVFSAIPDSVDHRWPSDEGSGSTLSNSLTSVDISLTFDDWVSGSQYNGGTAPDYPDNDGASVDSQITVNDSQSFIGAWFDNISANEDFAGVFTASSDGSIPTDGFMLFFESSSVDQLGLRLQDSGSNNEAFRNVSILDPSTNHIFIGLGLDGNEGELWVYDDAGNLDTNATGTASRGVTGDTDLSISTAFGDRDAQGRIDDIVAVESAKPTQSEVEEIVNTTGPNA
jgi:hypothetical protein